MSRKKTNPRRIPKSREQAINEARSEGVNLAKLSGEVKDGRVNVHDLIRVLRDEYDVEIGD